MGYGGTLTVADISQGQTMGADGSAQKWSGYVDFLHLLQQAGGNSWDFYQAWEDEKYPIDFTAAPATILQTSFRWGQTKQGYEHWEKIFVHLRGTDILERGGFIPSSAPVACSHEYVNVGFFSVKMACKHCGIDQ